ncbi:MAG: phosphoribosylglycinamide formyltransferase [Nanoarchaeota archaeon]
MISIGVLGSTKGSYLPNIVESINKGELKGLAKIVAVISDKEDSGILSRAKKYEIENYYLNPSGIERVDYDKKIAEIFDSKGVQLITLVGYMKLLSKDFVEKYRNRIMNIHPSLLPSFPGIDLEVHKQVLDSGCKVSGCTLFFVDERKDNGPIIMQKAVPVYCDDDAESLKTRVQSAEQKIYPRAIKLYALGKLKVEGKKVIILK